MISTIWCVGRNYARHAKELGHEIPTVPVVFIKAGASATPPGAFELAKLPGEIHHEIELAFRFDKDRQWDAAALAIDLTARDIQAEAKKKGLPWTLAKSFKNSCLLGPLTLVNGPSLASVGGHFSLTVNDQKRQEGARSDMLFSIEQIRTYLIENFPVSPGDWVLTGTPEGVGPLHPGDRLLAEGEGLVTAQWSVIDDRTAKT